MLEPRYFDAVDGLLAAVVAVKVVMPQNALVGVIMFAFASLLIGNAFGEEE